MVSILRAQSIKGWMSDAELLWLAEQARHCNCIYEVGCYLGRSTRVLADNCSGVVYAIDPWAGDYYSDDGSNLIIKYEGDNIYNQFVENLEPHISNNKVLPIRSKFSLEALDKHEVMLFPELIFLDGDHRYDGILHDIIIALDFSLNIIAGHDYTHFDWPGVKKAVDAVFGNKVNHVDSIWWVDVHERK